MKSVKSHKVIEVDIITSEGDEITKKLKYSKETEEALNWEISGTKMFAQEYKATDGYIFCDLEVARFRVIKK